MRRPTRAPNQESKRVRKTLARSWPATRGLAGGAASAGRGGKIRFVDGASSWGASSEAAPARVEANWSCLAPPGANSTAEVDRFVLGEPRSHAIEPASKNAVTTRHLDI